VVRNDAVLRFQERGREYPHPALHPATV